MKEYQNFIGGEWVPAASGERLVNKNPADTREEVASYAMGGRADAEAQGRFLAYSPASGKHAQLVRGRQ